MAAVLGVVLAVVLLLGLRELPHWLREQRASEQRRIAVVRDSLRLPAEARVTHYKSWHGVQHHLRFSLPAKRRPEEWVARMAAAMSLTRQSHQDAYTWAGEYVGVTYEPSTQDFRVHCSSLTVIE